jgi:hypothetical protein
MSEKLYSCKCPVPGHGCRCTLAQEMRPSKRAVSKLRRKRQKDVVNKELQDLEKDDE